MCIRVRILYGSFCIIRKDINRSLILRYESKMVYYIKVSEKEDLMLFVEML